jgi:hypothetical protein
LVGFLSYLVIGLGSFLFHSTLKCKCFWEWPRVSDIGPECLTSTR